MSPNYQFFPRGYLLGEEGRRDVGKGDVTEEEEERGSNPAGGCVSAKPTVVAPAEPTAMTKGGTTSFALGKRKK